MEHKFADSVDFLMLLIIYKFLQQAYLCRFSGKITM